MSFIRINPPGQPVRFIDLGPHSRGRVTAGGFVSMGGPIVDVRPARKEAALNRLIDAKGYGRIDRQEKPPHRPRTEVRCGILLARAGVPCARPPHASGWHRSAHAVEADNARRRKGPL